MPCHDKGCATCPAEPAVALLSLLCPAVRAVAKEKDLLRVPADTMPLEQCAMLRELFTAYRLLEDHASLKVGASVLVCVRGGGGGGGVLITVVHHV